MMNKRYRSMMEQAVLSDQAWSAFEEKLDAVRPAKKGSRVLCAVLIAACACVMLIGAAFAAHTVFSEEIKTPLKGQTAEIVYDEELDRTYLKWIGNGSPDLKIANGRMLLTLFDEVVDITDFCDEENYWVWDETDENGNRQVLIIGGTPEDWGWGYFLWSVSTSSRKVGIVEHLDRNTVWGQKAIAQYCPGKLWWMPDGRLVLETFSTPLKGTSVRIMGDGDGSRSTSLIASGAGYSEPRLEVVDGRMMLKLYDEVIDITDACSKKDYWVWDVTDELGVRQVLVIGGTPEDWSFIYFVYAEEGTAADIVHCYGNFIDEDDLWAEAALSKYYPEEPDYFEYLTSID